MSDKFTVSVAMMKDNETRYVVCLDQPGRPKDAMPWHDGRMMPFSSLIEENAQDEADRWARFLGADFIKTVLCDVDIGYSDGGTPEQCHEMKNLFHEGGWRYLGVSGRGTLDAVKGEIMRSIRPDGSIIESLAPATSATDESLS